MKKFTQNIIMIEPNRFDVDQIEWICTNLGVKKSLLLEMKSKGISKVWIWKKTGEIIFHKENNDIHVKHEKIKFDMGNIQTFRIEDCVKPTQKDLNVDNILDKINKLGINSLNVDEKKFLDSQ